MTEDNINNNSKVLIQFKLITNETMPRNAKKDKEMPRKTKKYLKSAVSYRRMPLINRLISVIGGMN